MKLVSLVHVGAVAAFLSVSTAALAQTGTGPLSSAPAGGVHAARINPGTLAIFGIGALAVAAIVIIVSGSGNGPAANPTSAATTVTTTTTTAP